MSIMKNNLPILENSSDIVNKPINEKLFLPEKLALVFLGDYVDSYAKSNDAVQLANFNNLSQSHIVYGINYNGDELAFCQAPVGGPANAQFIEWLLSNGVKSIIAVSTVKLLDESLSGAFMIGVKALRDEGTSYHFIEPSRVINLEQKSIDAIKQSFLINGVDYVEVNTWTADSFNKLNDEFIKYRLSEGYKIIEMECASMAAVAIANKINFGEFFVTRSSLVNMENYLENSWANDSYKLLMTLAFDALLNIID